MARLLSWVLMIPLAAAVVAFTISNRGKVSIDLWPSSFIIEVPLFAAVLVAAFFGFLVGALISFVSAGHRRARNRQLMRTLENSRREEAILKEQIKKLEATATKYAGPTTPLLTKADAA